MVRMALSTSSEYEDVELLMFEHSKHFAVQCDIDLTCYETFYDSSESSPSKVESGSIEGVYSKCDVDFLEVFRRNETTISYCSRVPDIDYIWPNRDGGMDNVLNLYNIVRDELFSDLSSEDFSPKDSTTCLSGGTDSLAVPTSLSSQQVPTLVDSISGNITDVSDSARPCLSPCTSEKAESRAEVADERSVTISPSPAQSTERDSENTDARVPSSCTSDFLPSGQYYIEE